MAATRRRRVVTAAVLAALATLAAVLILQNLSAAEKKITKPLVSYHAVGTPGFFHELGNLLGPPLVDGNKIETLSNGDEIFPSMLAAIRGAQKTITFETYIYWSGEVGEAFTEALTDRARAGVRVHLLIDWVGSGRMDASLLGRMEAAGVQIERYHPIHWYTLDRLNHRTHRKTLVVDGVVGFTGGVGIADKWLGHAQDPDHWREAHFRVEGPVVAQMQATFLDNWLKTRGELLHGNDYFPPIPAAGESLAQMFRSSSRGGAESVRLMYLMSIADARKSIRIANSYFVPDDLSVRALIEALRRGVSVEIIVPGTHTDTELVRKASRALWGELLAAGAGIYEYQPTMYHCKVMIVDDAWVSVGSTNFDERSFRLNDEANLNVYDPLFAREQVAIFDRDKAASRPVTLEQWVQRPWTEKLAEKAASLLRSQL
ncbi:MAG TPA: phospholipase D-like domain-containing protein [Thermoanaerobaculia bacterium]